MQNLHGIIFSYEKPSDLGDLIAHRIQGSLPFAGDTRMIDFILSSLKNAGVNDVGVIMHGKCQSLLDHLGNGKSWDLSRRDGGLRLLPSFATYENRGVVHGQFRGKMEALNCVRDYVEHIRQDYVVLCDSDNAINLPLQDVVQAHIDTGADITCVCTDHPGGRDDVYFTLDETDRITDVPIDMTNPTGWRCLNIFVVKKDLLLQLMEECATHNERDFQADVLQKRCHEMVFWGWKWQGYEAHINSVAGYYQRSMELLDPDVRNQLFAPERPIYAKENDAPSSYIDPGVECVNSLISEGCNIQGTVRNSIICRGVRVEKDAVVENCVLFKDVIVKKGAQIRCIIADKGVEIGEGVSLQGHEKYPVVVAKNSKV